MINVSGENIYPSEIERYTNNYRFISLSVAIPVINLITQNSIVLIYESKNNKKINIDNIRNELGDLYNYCKELFIWASQEIGLPEIPKAANKKILRKKLNFILMNFIKKSKISL